MELPSKLLFKLPRNWAFEFNFEGTVLSNFQCSFFHWKLKHLGESSLWFLQGEMTWNLPSVFDLDGLLDWLVYKDVTKIDLLLSQVCFRSQTFSLKFQRESFLCTWNVTVRHAIVGTGSHRHKSNSDCYFRVWPDFSN